MAQTQFSGGVISTAGFAVGTETTPINVIDLNGNLFGTSMVVGGTALGGVAGTVVSGTKQIGAVADNAAQTVLTLTCPNVNASAWLKLIVMVANKTTGSVAIYETALGYSNDLVLTRVVGNALVAASLGTATAQTSTAKFTGGDSATLTIQTFVPAGGASATNTIPIQFKAHDTTAGAPTWDYTVFWQILNGGAGTITAA